MLLKHKRAQWFWKSRIKFRYSHADNVYNFIIDQKNALRIKLTFIALHFKIFDRMVDKEDFRESM